MFITVINSPLGLWRIDPASLAVFSPVGGRSRRIRVGPLVDLAGLQAQLRSGTVDLDALWVATDRCQRDLQNNRWTNAHVLQMLVCLLADDYRGSEWCQVRGGRHVPSDVYLLPFDDLRQQRRPGGLEVYLKFSLEADGLLAIVLVSCHVSR